MTKSDADAADIACYRPITAIGSRVAPVIAQVELETGERLSVTPDHPIWNATAAAWLPVGECAVGDEVLDLTGLRQRIVAVTYDVTPTVVYNFEVDGTHTYYADGVWVHNCVKGFSAVWNNKHGPHLAKQLAYKAKNTGRAQSYFSGPRDQIEAFIATKLPLHRGAAEFRMPGSWGRVIHPDGQITFTDLIRIAPSGTGIKTAYPVPF